MLRSYVVIALRNLLRDKVVTSINIVGLSVAIAVSAILGIGVHGAADPRIGTSARMTASSA